MTTKELRRVVLQQEMDRWVKNWRKTTISGWTAERLINFFLNTNKSSIYEIEDLEVNLSPFYGRCQKDVIFVSVKYDINYKTELYSTMTRI